MGKKDKGPSAEGLRQLAAEIRQGTTSRNSFEHWEVSILLDLLQTQRRLGRSQALLDLYFTAALRAQAEQPGTLLLFSEFLKGRRKRQGPALLS